MRWPALIFLAMLIALQYPLWIGKGSVREVQEAEARLEAIREANQTQERRNADLAAEVKDLKSGYEAMEERARYELNLVKPGEVFVQLPEEHGSR
ncbi:MAG: cell division protein FtsB [Candidatus Dactylopiibacterium carminicum]|uniref:Cell division protein FtsB n=1 Tax=Candidatus Dactylopiibacterium carminicum TaxID=857335 RepID=A0A272ETY4_9RHOO|nr:cell division protein FtsB [Candidatus Dactylopiibacterium carminicum]KAF7599657.1 cell division protein FtsB [Candidatus Dactylopiibacterium carminicum]PAS93565.1 MAG: cell division protein FtsB [Candidatus Dactylopiibacterium carminicum]PAS99657.1 MAG: cell division protein FtsB [Candidatus Dactylopiibacterium carminicum]